MTSPTTPVPVPTQVRRPWRATLRTAFQAVIALAAMAPFLVNASGLEEQVPAVAGFLAVAGAITRIMAVPQVEGFLQTFVPFLSASPRAPS